MGAGSPRTPTARTEVPRRAWVSAGAESPSTHGSPYGVPSSDTLPSPANPDMHLPLMMGHETGPRVNRRELSIAACGALTHSAEAAFAAYPQAVDGQQGNAPEMRLFRACFFE